MSNTNNIEYKVKKVNKLLFNLISRLDPSRVKEYGCQVDMLSLGKLGKGFVAEGVFKVITKDGYERAVKVAKHDPSHRNYPDDPSTVGLTNEYAIQKIVADWGFAPNVYGDLMICKECPEPDISDMNPPTENCKYHAMFMDIMDGDLTKLFGKNPPQETFDFIITEVLRLLNAFYDKSKSINENSESTLMLLHEDTKACNFFYKVLSDGTHQILMGDFGVAYFGEVPTKKYYLMEQFRLFISTLLLDGCTIDEQYKILNNDEIELFKAIDQNPDKVEEFLNNNERMKKLVIAVNHASGLEYLPYPFDIFFTPLIEFIKKKKIVHSF